MVEDLEALGLAVAAGLGVAILPRQFASGLSEVVEVEPESIGARSLGPVAPRDLWMVVHRSKQHLPKVRVVIEWLERAFADVPRRDR